MKLSKGIVQVILANIVNLIISMGNGFLLPKFLSVESYADLKAFLLYTSYIGVLHLGYIDGIYIKYGGKKIHDIKEKEFIRDKKALMLFQIGITMLIVFIAAFLRDVILLLATISILPVNMVSFFRVVYQATGEFKEYRYITNLSTILIFISNLIFLFIIKTDYSIYYITMQVAVSFIVWIYYERKTRIVGIFEDSLLIKIKNSLSENIHLGIVIMLGNFMGIWITSIDRWFVKLIYNVAEFAYYSFAVTMLRLINVIVTAFSVTLYNFFCKIPQNEEITKLRRIVLVVGAIIITSIFPLHFFIQIYLENYAHVIPIIRILFMTQFLLVEVNAIYLNLYKAFNLQKKYLTQMVIITIVAFLSNIIIGYIWKDNIMAYAVATLFTAFSWLVLCQIDLPGHKMSINEWIYVFMTMIVYYMCSYFNVWIGMIIYLFWVIIETLILFPTDIKMLINIMLKKE